VPSAARGGPGEGLRLPLGVCLKAESFKLFFKLGSDVAATAVARPYLKAEPFKLSFK
jgi:hypothetical protein